MAETAPWDSQQAPEAPPWGDTSREGGLMQTVPQAAGMLSSPEGRGQLWQGVKKLPGDFVKGMVDWFETPGKAAKEGVSSEEEVGFGLNAALGTIGGRSIPRGVTDPIVPVAKAFDDGVIAPAAQRLNAYARTGDPNGVRLEPPLHETKGSPIQPIADSPFAGVPRSIMAKTGIPEVDAVLAHPQTKAVIDNAVVDRSRTIPYEAGGSVPLNKPTTYLDEHVPESFTVKRLSDPAKTITFDSAEPTIIHENVEETVEKILTDHGMEQPVAYKVAHFEFAEVAEHAWYTANDIDPVAAEAEWKKLQPGIQHEIANDAPADLYEKEYPGADVTKARHEDVFEAPPTPEEKARAFDIIRNAPELQPKSAAPMLQEARELGVIGDEPPQSLNQLPPREAGQRAIAASQRSPDKVTGEVDQPEQTAWRKRWEARLDNIGVTGDARDVVTAAVEANDEFVQPRQGDMRPGQIEQLATVTGLDSTKIDVAGTSSKIKTDAELRNTTEAFRIVNDKIQQAYRDLAAKRGVDDEAEMVEVTKRELQRDMLLDATTSSKELIAVRAEFARSGHTLNEFYKSMREANGLRDFLKDKQGMSPDDIRDRAKMIADTPADALPKVLNSLRAPKKPGWLFWIWQNGLISGPVTHTKYAEVNTVTVETERVIAPELAALIGKMRGDKVSLMAPLWANVGMVRGLGNAFTKAGEAFKTGLRVPLESEIELTKRAVENPELRGAQVPYTAITGPDWGVWKRVFNEDQLDSAAKALGIPGRSANMLHTFYKELSASGSASSRAYEKAWAEGVKGDEFTDRYNYHLINKTDEALIGEVDDAYSGAFMEKLGDKIGSLSRALSSNPATKWLFPFQHIPWNIERMTAKYSPGALLGTFVPVLRDTKMGQALRGELGHPAQNLALAKVVIGSTLLSYFALKGYSGAAHGGYPVDEKERRRWAMLGIQPNSAQIGGDWYSLDRFAMPGNLAKLGAGFGEIVRNYDGKDDHAMMKAAWGVMMTMVNQIADETGFQTTRNFIDVMDGRQSPTRFLAWQAGSFIPFSSLLSQGASFFDPEMRVADGLIEGLKYRIPFLREGLLPKRDPLYGEPLQNPGYHTIFRQNPVNADPIKSELDRIGQAVGWYPGAPQKNINHVKLTDEQYDRYEATAGPLVKQMLSAAVQSPHYQQMPDVGKQALLKGIIEAGRARARQAMQMWYPKELIDDPRAARRAQITGASP